MNDAAEAGDGDAVARDARAKAETGASAGVAAPAGQKAPSRSAAARFSRSC